MDTPLVGPGPLDSNYIPVTFNFDSNYTVQADKLNFIGPRGGCATAGNLYTAVSASTYLDGQGPYPWFPAFGFNPPSHDVIITMTGIPTTPVRTPVLIVPGIMGTEIFKGTDELWANVSRMLLTNNDRFMDPLAYKDDATPLDTSLTLGEVLYKKEIAGIERYNYTEKLVEDFGTLGYVRDDSVFMFPYDWRKDLRDIAHNDLTKKVDEILSKTGSQKVDIVAHWQVPHILHT